MIIVVRRESCNEGAENYKEKEEEEVRDEEGLHHLISSKWSGLSSKADFCLF